MQTISFMGALLSKKERQELLSALKRKDMLIPITEINLTFLCSNLKF